AHTLHNPLDLIERPTARPLVRRVQPRAEQKIAAEEIQRQIAVFLIVAMKEASFLFAVQRIVSRVQIDDDQLRRLFVRLRKDVDEKIIRPLLIQSDLFVAAILGGIIRTQLQAIERALAGKGSPSISLPSSLLPFRIKLAEGGGQERVPPQQIVIIEVFVSERHPINALP